MFAAQICAAKKEVCSPNLASKEGREYIRWSYLTGKKGEDYLCLTNLSSKGGKGGHNLRECSEEFGRLNFEPSSFVILL